ncbi:MCE family protein [Nocardia jinanensis]|uniref:Mammalian cell entry protein n=1 Tax=Nocardia jinanensis TaxID=382504 RepID=A0A917VVA3_9NOCA|nr:MCE family protein [Nocardia jinanensis]GGL17946.1 mammalian cell entry protein [Nocardia jinanensis]
MNRTPILRVAAGVLAVVVVAAAFALVNRTVLAPTTVRAIFTTATAIYPGDDVRVSGVKVGTIAGLEPRGTTVEMELHIDRGVDIPANAGAVIVAQSLIDSRYVQLTPAYRGDGDTMPDGAVIPLERTAVPVEWDEIKTQLTRLATELGPDGDQSSGPAGRFIDSAANALAGNGDKLRQVLTQLSGVGRILASGSGDIADTLENLQVFVTALRDSNVQIVQFQNRLATLTSVLDSSRSDLDAALNNLAVAVGEVQRFVAANRDKAGEQVGRLADVTQNLVDNRGELEELLHIFPTSLANFYNIYNPDTGTEAGVFVLNNFSNPIEFVCGGIASVENIGAEEAARKCRDYLGPVLGLMNFNYLPVPVNPGLGPSASPDNIIYSEPGLVPPAAQAVSPAAPPPPPAPTLAEILFPGGR